MKAKNLLLITAVLLAAMSQLQAQVGFNNPNPDPSSVIDLQATDKGILIPRLSSGLRQAMAIGAPTPAHGLMVMDTTLNRLYLWDNAQWRPVNVFIVDGTGGNEVLRIATEATIGAAYSAIAAPDNGLIVEGKMAVGNSNPDTFQLRITGDADVSENLTVGGNTAINGSLSASALNVGALSSTTLTASGTVTGGNYNIPSAASTNSPVPSGGIIMWSGTIANIPAGWALCDGSNGTPDLRDRFVVGAGSTYNVNGTGGAASHSHTTNSVADHDHGLPSHTGGITSFSPTLGNHPSTYYTMDDGGNCSNPTFGSGNYLETGTGGCQEGQHSHQLVGTTAFDGGHDHTVSTANNLPPYLALAYIMKL